MRYLDTGGRDPDHTLGRWLADRLTLATYFGCQTGYISADGVAAINDPLSQLLMEGGDAHVVVGSNGGGVLSADLIAVLDIFETAGAGSLVLVGAADVLMHPKTFYIEDSTGRRHAFVGSANLTSRGLDGNIEAGISLDSEDDEPEILDSIRDAIRAWSGRPNAVQITRPDLVNLAEDGAVDRPNPRPPTPDSEQRERHARRFPALGRMLHRRSTSGRQAETSGSGARGRATATPPV